MRRFQFAAPIQQDGCSSRQVTVMNKHIQISCWTSCQVAVDGRSQHNTLKRYGRNFLVIERFKQSDQFGCIRQALERVALVFGS
jgi:hypothetical protein